MLRALVLKELREVAGIAAAGLLAYLALAAAVTGVKAFGEMPGLPRGTSGVPFVEGGFLGPFIVVGLALAAALGLRQSLGESAGGTFLFLLHRPLAREKVFAAKLFTGAGLLMLCAAVPVLLYGLWASLGRHPAPFEWSMTGPAWRVVLLLPLVYLGAFLSGLRSAKWFGTRLLPLAGAVVVFALAAFAAWWWWWAAGLLASLAAYWALVGAVWHVADNRDYA